MTTTNSPKSKPILPLLVVAEANRGRVTGWSVVCREHGVMPVLAPGRSAGVTAAAAHRRDLHRGEGLIRVERPGQRKARRRAS